MNGLEPKNTFFFAFFGQEKRNIYFFTNYVTSQACGQKIRPRVGIVLLVYRPPPPWNIPSVAVAAASRTGGRRVRGNRRPRSAVLGIGTPQSRYLFPPMRNM